MIRTLASICRALCNPRNRLDTRRQEPLMVAAPEEDDRQTGLAAVYALGCLAVLIIVAVGLATL